MISALGGGAKKMYVIEEVNFGTLYKFNWILFLKGKGNEGVVSTLHHPE